jgi:hypothetical protein
VPCLVEDVGKGCLSERIVNFAMWQRERGARAGGAPMTEIEFTKIESTPDGYTIRVWGAVGWDPPIRVEHLRGTIAEGIGVCEPGVAGPAGPPCRASMEASALAQRRPASGSCGYTRVPSQLDLPLHPTSTSRLEDHNAHSKPNAVIYC